jgi:hypothetical protein
VLFFELILLPFCAKKTENVQINTIIDKMEDFLNKKTMKIVYKFIILIYNYYIMELCWGSFVMHL